MQFTAEVTSDGGLAPTGFVQFSVDGHPVGAAVSLVDGAATSATLADLAPGSHTVGVLYSGDLRYSPGTAELTQVVGVIAIMMISVTERTREIGVRKALGATRWTILWQFLVEAVTLTGIGASVGLILGILVAVGVRTAFPSIPASTSWGSVAASLGISAITGVIFGMLPAVRAARLDPVTALRYE